MSDSRRTPLGVLFSYEGWEDLPKSEKALKLEATKGSASTTVELDEEGNAFLPKARNELLPEPLITVDEFRTYEERFLWRRWLHEMGLGTPIPRRGVTAPQGAFSVESKEMGKAFKRLVEYGTEGHETPLKMAEIESDMIDNMSSHIQAFFKKFPWLKLWTDPDADVLYDLRVNFELRLVEVKRGKPDEEE